MSILKTLNQPKKSTISNLLDICKAAKQMEDSGEYNKAISAMGGWWQGGGVRPNLNKVAAEEKAAVLTRIGSLSGWFGSMNQVPESQDKAKDLISEGANLFETLNDRQSWAEARSDLAVCYWREGAFDEARVILQDVLDGGYELSSRLRSKILLRSVNVEISTKHYERAMLLLDQAAPLIREDGDDLLRGKLHFHRALIKRNQGEDLAKTELLFSSIEDYLQAAAYYKKARHNLFEANVENNLGNVYRLLKDFKNTHAHLDKAIYLYIKLKDQAHAALVYENKAQAYLAEDQLKDAEAAARTSVEMVKKGGEQSLLAECLTTLGTVLGRRKNVVAAAGVFNEAKDAALTVDDLESAGNAVLTQLEELQSNLSPKAFRELYIEADELLKTSPRLKTLNRLKEIAKKQFESGQPESDKMAKLLSYADKLDTLFENETGEGSFNWEDFSLPEAVRKYEGEIILKALTETSGRVTRAAILLGLSHQNLSLILHQRHKELKKHCVQRKPRSAAKVKIH